MVNTKKAFTLVELIIIITALAAMFTTAFIVFQGDKIETEDNSSQYSYDINISGDNSYKRMQMARYYDENSSELVVSNYSIDDDI